jgi:hypothetical protein
MKRDHATVSAAEAEAQATDPRAPYEAPRLTRLGDLRELTLGTSPGTGDSGAPGTRRLRT